MLIDTHCHLDFERFDADRTAVVARALAAGVQRIIVPGIDLENCPAVLAVAARFPSVLAAVGIHPNSSAGWQTDWLDQIRAWAADEHVVAIGEIGLDYYWDLAPQKMQQQAFAAQLALAAELDLPVIVHNREASADVLRLLAGSPLAGRLRAGVLHSFSGTWAAAEQALALGFYLGFTGPVTFKKADELRDVLVRMPLERLLVETDAPFLAPHPHRGKRNEPAYVALVAERIAAVRGLPVAEVAEITSANAIRLFGEQLVVREAHDG